MYDLLLRHPFMSGEGLEATQAQALVAAMRDMELALASEQEQLGLLPEGTADALALHLTDDVFDLVLLAADTAKGGNAAIPFVKQAKAALPDALKPHFHRGATSQDILDSALMLLLKPRLARCLSLLERSRASGCTLMSTHRDTAMVGRTLMQQALPITFGAKVANWLWGLSLAERRLRDCAEHGLYVQLGGAVGVHSGLDEPGLALMDGVAARLGLSEPLLPWHTDRQPILALAGALDATAVGAEKIALDIALLCQTEVAELSEPAEPGVGESSSMPHKRNPVGCARIRSSARQIHGLVSTLSNAAAQPLERGLGEWHAEWAPLLDATLLLEGALETLTVLLEGVEVHRDAMQRNLMLTGGAIMAEPAARVLTPSLGSDEAKRIARESAEIARQQQRSYAEVLLAHDAISDTVDAETLRAAVDPNLYIGSSRAQVERALKALK